MTDDPAATALSVFEGLPQAPARALLCHVCTAADSPVPDGLLVACSGGQEAAWLAGAADRTSLVGLLWRRLTSEQRQRLPDAIRHRLADLHLAYTMRGEALKRLVERLVARLGEHGIPAILLKGAGLVRTVYGDPAERPMRDLDLLLPDADLGRAQELLADSMVEARLDRPGSRHLGAMVLSGEYASVELHGVTEHVRWWPQVEAGDPFAGAASVQVGTATAQVLRPADNLLHIACHGVRHGFGDWPTMAADLARMCRSNTWGPDRWEAVWEAARLRRRSRALAVALSLAHAGRLPGSLRGILADPAAADADRRARIGWRLAFDWGDRPPNCWHRAWVRDGVDGGADEVRGYVLPPLRRVARRFGTSVPLAGMIYPWYASARAGRAVCRGARWCWTLRRSAAGAGRWQDARR